MEVILLSVFMMLGASNLLGTGIPDFLLFETISFWMEECSCVAYAYEFSFELLMVICRFLMELCLDGEF